MTTPALDPEQRSRLLGVKLDSLVTAHWGAADDADRRAVPFSAGAAVVQGPRAWLLVDASSAAGVGSALAWARQQGVDEVSILADAAGAFARQAGHFADPPDVFTIDGRAVRPAVAEALPPEPEPHPDAVALIPELERAGLDVSIEHGVISGEVLGLEVARITMNAAGAARIEVGVGRNDRDAFALVHGELPSDQALATVVASVRTHRRPDGPAHPLHRLAGERWLRAHVMADPHRLPGWVVEPAAGPVPRAGVMDAAPAIAVGRDAAGAPVVLACSVGIDLELVPVAADARAVHRPDARLVLAVPARDAHAVTGALAERLVVPAEVLPIEGDWRR